MRNLKFEESSNGRASYYGMSANVGYLVTPSVRLFLDGSFNAFPNVKASTRKLNTTTGQRAYTSGDAAGIAQRYYYVSLGLSYRF